KSGFVAEIHVLDDQNQHVPLVSPTTIVNKICACDRLFLLVVGPQK
ncbi:unnamed protein product, partial [Musa hybrid cultivar]